MTKLTSGVGLRHGTASRLTVGARLLARMNVKTERVTSDFQQITVIQHMRLTQRLRLHTYALATSAHNQQMTQCCP